MLGVCVCGGGGDVWFSYGSQYCTLGSWSQLCTLYANSVVLLETINTINYEMCGGTL